MSMTELANALPEYAIDLKSNLNALAAEAILSEQQRWGCFLACAYATGEPVVIAAFEREADARLTVEAPIAAKRAASIMAMNTVYYSAVNLLQNHDYRAEPAGLAMSALTHPGVDKIDFELWALAVSALSGCAACLNAHEIELRKRGVSLERIHAALRIAAVVASAATTVRLEAADSGEAQ